MEGKSPLIAVDTNVLIDLADDHHVVWDAIDTVKKRIPRADLVATSTVIEELAIAADDDSKPETKRLALLALQSFIKWGVRPLDFTPVGHGINQRVADRIRQGGLLPDEEVNDSYVIAEAALAECRLIITSDGHILEIDVTKLGAVLAKCDVATPLIVSPHKIAKDFFPKK